MTTPASTAYRGRLAPSPTGALHLGNARTFLVAWLRARQAGGALLLRMEDIDGPRVKRDAAAEALADLAWLGLDWDEGPDRGGPHAPYTQSERSEAYVHALAALSRRGLAYPCVCTRREIADAASAPHGPDGPIYPGTCRGRFPDATAAETLAGRPPALRFRVAAGGPPVEHRDAVHGPLRYEPASLGDFVVAKGTGEPAYQLAVVVDDAAMGVTEVVRADDLLPSTPRQLLLYEALGLRPPRFVHVPLVVGPCGRRLAKRHGDTRIRALREAGASPERVIGLLAASLGVSGLGGEARPGELLERFTLEAVPRAPWVVDVPALEQALGVRGLAAAGKA